MKNREKLIALLLLISLPVLGATIYYFGFHAHTTPTPVETKASVPTPIDMTVFIHGSFGTTLSLLSAVDVLKDDFRGSQYHQVTKKMREDEHFYQNQPILQRGLVALTPTFDTAVVHGKKLAAYPIINTYDLFYRKLFPRARRQQYYTFGWTGFLGQKSRRYESIRLFNALTDEVKQLKNTGYDPRIRLICHSHGGNVALNLDLINHALSGVSDDNESDNRREALAHMSAMLEGMGTRDDVKDKEGQKQLDFYPEATHLAIHELILFGCPVQPETDHCLVSPTFEHTYHFYSEQDMIQPMDWISTKQAYSKRRLELDDINRYTGSRHPGFTQSKITIEKSGSMAMNTPSEKPSFFQKILHEVGLVSNNSDDPGHKELWFAQWKKVSREDNLVPFPIVIFTPYFLELCQQDAELVDSDMHIVISDDEILFFSSERGTQNDCRQHTLAKTTLKQIESVFEQWRPSNVTAHSEFEIINHYSKLFRTA